MPEYVYAFLVLVLLVLGALILPCRWDPAIKLKERTRGEEAKD